MLKPSRMKPSVHTSIFNLPLLGRPLLSFVVDLWAVRTCFFVPCVSGNVGFNMCVLFRQNRQLLLLLFLSFFLTNGCSWHPFKGAALGSSASGRRCPQGVMGNKQEALTRSHGLCVVKVWRLFHPQSEGSGVRSPPDRSAQSEPNERTESSYGGVAHMHELYMPDP